MHIDAYPVLVESNGNHKVGRLPSNAGQFAQVFDRVGYPAVEFPIHDTGQLFQVSGFGAPETDREDEFLKPLERDLPQVIGSLDLGEQTLAHLGRGFVFRASAQDGGNKDLEGIAGLGMHEFHYGRVALEILTFEYAIYDGYVIRVHDYAGAMPVSGDRTGRDSVSSGILYQASSDLPDAGHGDGGVTGPVRPAAGIWPYAAGMRR